MLFVIVIYIGVRISQPWSTFHWSSSKIRWTSCRHILLFSKPFEKQYLGWWVASKLQWSYAHSLVWCVVLVPNIVYLAPPFSKTHGESKTTPIPQALSTLLEPSQDNIGRENVSCLQVFLRILRKVQYNLVVFSYDRSWLRSLFLIYPVSFVLGAWFGIPGHVGPPPPPSSFSL